MKQLAALWRCVRQYMGWHTPQKQGHTGQTRPGSSSGLGRDHASMDKFLHLPVNEVMIPRSDIQAVSCHASFEQVVSQFLQSGFQWLPVYRGTLDTIIGIISVHSMLALRESDNPEDKWPRHLNTPLFCPSSMSLKDAMTLMRYPHKAPALFVVDEHGGIEGMVPKWHIIKALFQLYDHDWVEQEQMILARTPVPLVNGRIELEAFCQEFSCPALLHMHDEHRVHTLGGWICTYVGRVPLTGEIIAHPSGFTFEIRQATPRTIHHIALLQTPQEFSTADDNTTGAFLHKNTCDMKKASVHPVPTAACGTEQLQNTVPEQACATSITPKAEYAEHARLSSTAIASSRPQGGFTVIAETIKDIAMKHEGPDAAD